eukprot:COSAG01_NODE_3739_length_5746_cov_4.418984_8_plen_89_part_00
MHAFLEGPSRRLPLSQWPQLLAVWTLATGLPWAIRWYWVRLAMHHLQTRNAPGTAASTAGTAGTAAVVGSMLPTATRSRHHQRPIYHR